MNKEKNEKRKVEFLTKLRDQQVGNSYRYTFDMAKKCPDCGTPMKYI